MRPAHMFSHRGAASDPVSVGLIGCGRVATRWHLPALRSLPEVRIAALCDVDPSRLEGEAARFGVERRHREPGALIADPAVDAVAVCAPATEHAELGRAALEAGKHVFVEKPLALDLDSCDALIAAAERSGRVAATGFNLRFHRLVRRARELLAAGAIGRVEAMRTMVGGHEAGSPAWARRRELGGGSLIEVGVHHFDLWRHLLGAEVSEVAAVSRSEGMDDRTAIVQARMSDGALLSTLLTRASSPANEVSVLGDAGRLDLSLYRFDGLSVAPASGFPGDARARFGGLAATLRELPAAVRTRRHGNDFDASYAQEWRAFVAAVRGDVPVQCGFDAGRGALSIALAAIESAHTAGTVTVDGAAGSVGAAVGDAR